MIKSYFQRSGDTVTGLVMVFSKPLDPATAQDVSTYQISRSVRNHTSSDGFSVSASAAVYNPSQDSVTLILAQPFKLSPAPMKDTFFVGLTPGSTITDTSGNVLIYASAFLLYGKPTLSSSNLAEFVAKGPSPSPFFHTFDQSRINTLLSKNATPKAIAAAAAARSQEAAQATANAASTAAAQAEMQAAQAAAAAAFAGGPKIHLTGTIQGTYSPHPSYFTEFGGQVPFGIQTMMNGAGSISPVGQVTENIQEAPWDTQRSNQTLDTNQGLLNESFDLHSAGPNSIEGTYTIHGALSGPYQWASGSGHIVITWTGNHSRGNYTEVYS